MSATGDPGDPSGREAGSTLIEALVVVSITVMIGMIGFPMMGQGIANAAFGQASSGVRADFRIARAQALATGERVDIVVADDGRGYGWSPGPRRALVAGLTMSPVGPVASFYPDGSASGVPLSLTNGRSMERFEVDPVTGAPRAAS
ncbi:MAG: hypothetical protein P4L64_14620 [Caulobacteraceae bacterium]|nr:hypothetical protein [Caulobacteraceae bacterium]